MAVGLGCQPGRRTTLSSASLRGESRYIKGMIRRQLGNCKRNRCREKLLEYFHRLLTYRGPFFSLGRAPVNLMWRRAGSRYLGPLHTWALLSAWALSADATIVYLNISGPCAATLILGSLLVHNLEISSRCLIRACVGEVECLHCG